MIPSISRDRTADIPYVHKPSLTQARARGPAVINTDSLGLRAKTAGATYGIKRSNEYRIAIVGNFCTFGEGIARTGGTFVQVLEDTLNQQQQAVTVKVFNYGASAYSVKKMARRSRSWNRTGWRPRFSTTLLWLRYSLSSWGRRKSRPSRHSSASTLNHSRDRHHLRVAPAISGAGLDRNGIALPGDDWEERDEQEEV
jgi:hypothetical protein